MKLQIEKQIRRILATETNPTILSNSLFAPGGLFNQLVQATGKDRRVISQSPLFQKAQHRLSELEYSEAEELFKAVEKIRMKKNIAPTAKADGSPLPGPTRKSSRKSQTISPASSKKRR